MKVYVPYEQVLNVYSFHGGDLYIRASKNRGGVTLEITQVPTEKKIHGRISTRENRKRSQKSGERKHNG